jgi:hypothetical protein
MSLSLIGCHRDVSHLDIFAITETTRQLANAFSKFKLGDSPSGLIVYISTPSHIIIASIV